MEVQQLLVSLIKRSPFNTRICSENDADIKELAASIRTQGLLQPIIVREKSRGFELIAGERRLTAFKVNGEKEIPAIIRNAVSDSEACEIIGIENIQRKNLTIMQQAGIIHHMLNNGGRAENVAEKLGTTAANILRQDRLNSLAPDWQRAINNPAHPISKWTISHLVLIARYCTKEQEELYKIFGNKSDEAMANLSVNRLKDILAPRMLAIKDIPWMKNDIGLLPAYTTCDKCQTRTDRQLSLFEDESGKTGKGAQCVNRQCYGQKLAAYGRKIIPSLEKEYPGILIFDLSEGNGIINRKHPVFGALKITKHGGYEQVDKGSSGSVPVYILDGPGAGSVKFFKKVGKGSEEKTGDKTTGRGHKKTDKKIKGAVESVLSPEQISEIIIHKTIVRFIEKVILILTGSYHESTGSKLGTCWKCGKNGGDVEKWGIDRRICSECYDSVISTKNPEYFKILKAVSPSKVFALIYFFGARPVKNGIPEIGMFDKMIDDFKLEKFKEIALANCIDNIVGVLEIIKCVRDRPDIAYVRDICTFLGIDQDRQYALYQSAESEIKNP